MLRHRLVFVVVGLAFFEITVTGWLPPSPASRSLHSRLQKRRRKASRSLAVVDGDDDDESSPSSLANQVRLLTKAGIVGATTGTAVSVLKLTISATETYTYNDGLRALFQWAGDASNTLLVSTLVYASVPALGGACVGALRSLPYFSAETELGALCRAMAAVATLGTGNSLGPEGPAVDIGRAVSRTASRGDDNDDDERIIIQGAGCAAAVAAGFSAPVAGIFFALETREETVALPRSAVAASALAAAVSALIARDVMQSGRLQLVSPSYVLSETGFPLVELPSYLGLGALAGLVAIALRRTIIAANQLWSDDGAVGSRVPLSARPALGGAICGIVGVSCPPVLFNGYATLNTILADTSPPDSLTLLQYCGVKMATTASSLACGLVGGLFAPSLFLGATAGGAYGQIVSGAAELAATTFGIDSGIPVPAAAAYATVGAASVLAAIMRAPLTSAMLLFELTRDYEVVLPLIASAGVASVVIEIFEPVSSATDTQKKKNEELRLEDDDTEQLRENDMAAAATTAASTGKTTQPSTLPLPPPPKSPESSSTR